MKQFVVDLHIHSLLSPCAEIEMTPHHIVLQAAAHHIDAIAITDHNVSGNVEAAIKAGERYGVQVLPGMELECKEEAHLLVLFDTWAQMERWQQRVDRVLPALKNNPQKFGAQFVVDDDDNFVAEEERLLLTSVNLEAEKAIQQVNALGGMVIAAHIDRPSYSLLGQLGFFYDELTLAAVEISHVGIQELANKKLKRFVANLPYVTNSDAHCMDTFLSGPKNLVVAEKINIEELKLALKGEKGRSVQAGYFLESK